jgi:hypothetical protein
MKKFISVQISEGKADMDCIDKTCKKGLNQHEFISLIDDEQKKKLENNSLRSYLSYDPNWIPCIKSDCNSGNYRCNDKDPVLLNCMVSFRSNPYSII